MYHLTAWNADGDVVLRVRGELCDILGWVLDYAAQKYRVEILWVPEEE